MSQSHVTDQLKSQIEEIDAKIADAKDLLADPELAQLAQEDIQSLTNQKQALEESITSLTADYSDLPDTGSDINPNRATLEIRAGAGGEEAKIWAEDLLRMYMRFAESHKFGVEALDSGIVKITGKNIYTLLKYESGVHRVQRVPETESQGRIHTSTASVAVLPIINPKALEIREEDLDWQFVRSGGAGGQNVNKVNTAVRLTHVPTDIVVLCSKERTQVRNREIALEVLRSQLWEIEEEKRLGSLESQRKAAVGRAMRAEKIRTYNYPQNRVTDHRANLSWHNLDSILEGNLEKMLTQITTAMSDSDQDESPDTTEND